MFTHTNCFDVPVRPPLAFAREVHGKRGNARLYSIPHIFESKVQFYDGKLPGILVVVSCLGLHFEAGVHLLTENGYT